MQRVGKDLAASGLAQIVPLIGHKVTLVDKSVHILTKSKQKIQASLASVAKKESVEKPKRTLATSAKACRHVTIIGGGLRSLALVQVIALGGLDVTLVDKTDDILTQSKQYIQMNLAGIFGYELTQTPEYGQKLLTDAMSRVSVNTDVVQACKSTDLVIEAMEDDVVAKQTLFASLDAAAPSHTIFTSDTPELSIKDIASSTKRKDRFAGLYFLHPVPMMTFVEIVPLDETSDVTVQSLINFCHGIKKLVFTTKGTTKGYILHRARIHLMLTIIEAIRIVESGEFSAQNVDICMRMGGVPPALAMADLIGLDNCKDTIDELNQNMADKSLFRPSPLLNALVSEGKTGRIAGEGFFKYNKKKTE